jgi:hypothetical protein
LVVEVVVSPRPRDEAPHLQPTAAQQLGLIIDSASQLSIEDVLQEIAIFGQKSRLNELWHQGCEGQDWSHFDGSIY